MLPRIKMVRNLTSYLSVLGLNFFTAKKDLIVNVQKTMNRAMLKSVCQCKKKA